MALFIANPTKQHNHFFYRMPEVQRLLDVVIPAGGQIELAKHLNASRAQLETIISEHDGSGLVSVNEAKRLPKVSLIYSWDKPVDLDSINNGIISNDDAALAVADEMRLHQTAAIIDDLATQIGSEPETADVIVSEVERSGGKAKTTVVRSVGKGSK